MKWKPFGWRAFYPKGIESAKSQRQEWTESAKEQEVSMGARVEWAGEREKETLATAVHV